MFLAIGPLPSLEQSCKRYKSHGDMNNVDNNMFIHSIS